MKKRFTHILLAALICVSGVVEAQIAHIKKSPASFSLSLNEERQEIFFNAPEIPDQSTPLRKDEPNIFAYPIDVDINFNKEGKWVELDDGSRIWQLTITSVGAKNLNFHFDEFRLAKGAEFYAYNSTKTDIRGAFTHQNNKPERTFALYLLKGESVTLEYYEPATVTGRSRINISRIYYGIKGVMDFGNSGPCNNNVNCPIGSDWQMDKKAVALIVAGGVNGTRWCTGSMVNNVREDGTPYFLTANHCLSGSESSWAFVFNYESPSCANVDGSLTQSVLGAQVLANDAPSDFALLLLDASPPISYGVYHAGWDARDLVKDSTVAIHHPRGDIKKISFDYNSVVSSGYFAAGNDHWEVLDWDTGTTEPTSSGSPLFDKDHRIIGQLHGGSAACSNDLEDYYGKFSYSWNTGATASKRLKDWLDPDNSGTTYIDGNNFNVSQDTLDVAMLPYTIVDNRCDTTVPGIEAYFKNLGNDTITSVTLQLNLNGDSIEQQSWSGNLGFSNVESVIFNNLTVTEDTHSVVIFVVEVNGTLDSNFINDSIVVDFWAINGNKLNSNVTTDFFGYETSIEILDSNNNVINSGTGYSSNSTTPEEWCLPDGCYTFVLKDSYGDGINNGGVSISIGGQLIGSIDGNFFNYSDSLSFCIEDGFQVVDSFLVDLAPTSINIDQSLLCGEPIDSINFTIQNYGSRDAIGFTTILTDNGVDVDTTIWNDTVLAMSQKDFSVAYVLPFGSHNIKITTLNAEDSNTVNNLLIESFLHQEGREFTLEMNPHSLGPDVSYHLYEEATEIYSGSNFNFNVDIVETFCLDSGCYSLVIRNNGESGLLTAEFTFSYQGQTLGTFNDYVGDSLYLDFCYDGKDGIISNSGWVLPPNGFTEEIVKELSLNIYPNPSNGNFTIKTDFYGSYLLVDLYGKVVVNDNLNLGTNEVSLTDLPKGVYFFIAESPSGKLTRKIIIH